MKPFDLQVNGYAGTDFCSTSLNAEQLHHACRALADDGVDGVLATFITDDLRTLKAKLSNLVRLREEDELARQVIAGFHLEGPFLNPKPGYIGAHEPELVRPACLEDAQGILEVGEGLVKLLTLAPEQDSGGVVTKFLVEAGVVVSAGHCDPSIAQLKAVIDGGLSMVTHFGNGCPVELSRHDNVLQRFLSLREHLWFCFIPDGVHVDFFALKNYLDLVGVDRSIMTTDAISAATLGPGMHEISGISVEVDEAGVSRRPGSANLAGSTVTMPRILHNLSQELGLSEEEIIALVDRNPRIALGL
ncbi:MAG: N-acetylglucosamine-6-phosphate deacetylase [Opitutae bacterium]|nr:N-acetylglucosamine-6-phosphate deacetylase [Opitutae bacterium]